MSESEGETPSSVVPVATSSQVKPKWWKRPKVLIIIGILWAVGMIGLTLGRSKQHDQNGHTATQSKPEAKDDRTKAIVDGFISRFEEAVKKGGAFSHKDGKGPGRIEGRVIVASYTHESGAWVIYSNASDAVTMVSRLAESDVEAMRNGTVVPPVRFIAEAIRLLSGKPCADEE